MMRRLSGTKYKRGLLFLSLFVAVLAVSGGLLLPRWAHPRLETALSSALQRQVTIGSIDFNPFIMKATLHQVNITDKGAPFVRFKSLTLDVGLASLWRMAPVFNEITLIEPQLDIVRLDATRFNFSDLLTQKEQKKTDSGLPKFSLNNIRLEKGTINFTDRLLNSSQKISDLQLALPFISTLSHRVDEYIQPSLSGKLNGTDFKLEGSSKPFSTQRFTRLSFNLHDLNIPQYAGYFTLPNALQLNSARLSGKLNINFNLEKDRTRLIIEGPLELNQLDMAQAGKPFIKIKQLAVRLKDFEPLAEKYHIADIKLDGFNAVLDKDTQSHFASSEPAVSAPPAKGGGLAVDHLQISNSRIAYEDLSLNAIKLDASGFTDRGTKAVPVKFSAQSDFGEQISADLKLLPQPFALDGKINLTALKLDRYSALLAPYFKGDIKKGLLDVATTAHLTTEPLAYTLKDTDIKLHQFDLQLANKPILAIDEFAIKALAVDSGQRLIKAELLESQRGELTAQLLANGQLNFAALLPATKAAKADPAAPWRVQTGKMDISGWQFNLSDQRLAKAPAVPVRDVAIIYNNFDTQPGSKGTVDIKGRWGNKGLIDISGEMIPLPFSSQLAIDLRNADAAFLQPYFTKYLNIKLARGFLTAKGDLQLATQPKFSGRYRGAFSADQFYAVDKLTSNAFLKWNRLGFKGMDIVLAPLKIDIAEVALDKFYSRLILSPQGRLNLQDIMVQDGKRVSVDKAPQTTAASSVVALAVDPQATALPPVNIKKVVLSNGDIRYSDFFIKPNFTANLTGMSGVINGLSSSENARAQLDLNGFVDKSAPVHLSGTLNPLAKKIFIDLKGGVKNYDLTSASTYSGKYAGYGIEKGKLSMDIAYKIDNSQLSASNSVFLDQFTLSDEKVDSKEATTLPVKLAISLLTDRRGQINLNIPVEGSLDDPQFSVTGVLWQVVGNLMEKVITAPFDALANSFGHDGPSLSQVSFIPGSDKLTPDADKSIKKLAEILTERPALKLDIQSMPDLVADAAGLKISLLQMKMKNIKLAKLTEKIQSIENDSDLQIGKEEYPDLLEQVYKKEKFAKPTNLIGMDKSLSVPEMEKLIFANTAISNENLNALGLRRAAQVKAALAAAGVQDGRMFVVQPKLSNAADQKPRVQFNLK
ncbi:MAG: DUF748 domain-containing protein [Iodobacter sp.]